MSTFIEDYLSDPSGAISAARQRAQSRNWFDGFDDNQIYEEIASPEFHLYEAVVMSGQKGITPHESGFAVVV